jgi:hypothetical protein
MVGIRSVGRRILAARRTTRLTPTRRRVLATVLTASRSVVVGRHVSGRRWRSIVVRRRRRSLLVVPTNTEMLINELPWRRVW